MDYCEWLSVKLERSGFHVTLPMDSQWESAVRGTDGGEYRRHEKNEPERANDAH